MNFSCWKLFVHGSHSKAMSGSSLESGMFSRRHPWMKILLKKFQNIYSLAILSKPPSRKNISSRFCYFHIHLCRYIATNIFSHSDIRGNYFLFLFLIIGKFHISCDSSLSNFWVENFLNNLKSVKAGDENNNNFK